MLKSKSCASNVWPGQVISEYKSRLMLFCLCRSKWSFNVSFNYREGLVFHNIGCACALSCLTCSTCRATVACQLSHQICTCISALLASALTLSVLQV